jgi:hypothetical protein
MSLSPSFLDSLLPSGLSADTAKLALAMAGFGTFSPARTACGRSAVIGQYDTAVEKPTSGSWYVTSRAGSEGGGDGGRRLALDLPPLPLLALLSRRAALALLRCDLPMALIVVDDQDVRENTLGKGGSWPWDLETSRRNRQWVQLE